MCERNPTLQDMPDTCPHLEFWTAVHEVIESAERTLPSGDDPRRAGWDHPDELWKNDAELAHYEDKLRSEIYDMARFFCDNCDWPKKTRSEVRYLVAKRLIWARDFIRILSIPNSDTQSAAIPRPPHSGWEVIFWLLTDAYENRFPPQPYIPMYFPPADRF